MSSTRTAADGRPFRQEKYCSSPEFERGLMGNLVAKRCEVLDSAEDRDLIWFLQLLSHAPGGLKKLAADLVQRFPARIATDSMLKFGIAPGQVYTEQQAATVRLEISLLSMNHLLAEQEAAPPDGYPAADFLEVCRAKAEKLDELLTDLCLNPQTELAWCAPFYFPALVESLREFKAAWIETKRAGQVITELGRQVSDTLDYALDGRCLVLIDGLARTGKTFSARAWCDLHPGQARYVQVPSSNDDIGFFRAIAKSLGVSINQNSKAQQLRDRIEDVLQRGHLCVVFDEAHYLFPQASYRAALPSRVNWIMTALVNQGVPVAMVTTPQFMRSQKSIEDKSCWTSEQFIGRIGHFQKLPDSLSADDLRAVSKASLPEGCPKSIETLVAYAQGSAKYLAAIESAVRRARFLAGKAAREKVIFADVRNAIKESVIPSDTALAVALADPKRTGRSRTMAAPVPQPPREATAAPARPAREAQPTPAQPEDLAAVQSLGADRTRQDLTTA